MPYKFNPISGQMDYYQASTGSTDVTSSAVIANDAVVRGDGGVRGVQGSGVIIDDSDVVTGITKLDVDNLRLDGNTIISTDADGNINITPNGTGVIAGTELTLTTDLAVENGGTGGSSNTAYAVLCGGTTSTGAQQSIASVGTSGQLLQSNGAGALPTFVTVASGFTPAIFNKDYMWGWAEMMSADNNPNGFGRYASGGSGGYLAGEAGHPGIIQITTSTSATGFAKLYGGQKGFSVGGGEITVEWCINLKTALSDGTETYTAFIGIFEEGLTTKLSAAGDLIGFRYTHSENSGNWTALCKEDGSETTADLEVAVGVDEWVRLKVIINAAGTSVGFYINDVEGANSPLTTNIPDSSDDLVLATAIEKSLGTTSRSLLNDYCEWLQAFTSSRND